MKVLILTSSLNGTASHHLNYLIQNKTIQISMVIFSEGHVKYKNRLRFKKIAKLFKIGFLGALNGIRMRNWYTNDLLKYIKIDDLEKKCSEFNIPFRRTGAINSSETEEIFKQADADLGISLGNGYISKRIFSIPKNGMINIHHEILPQFQNAQSVIWQLYNGSANSGYTIHKIDRNIDQGEIIFQEQIPIEFSDSLSDTVTRTYMKLLEKSVHGLIKVLENFDYYYSQKKPQHIGNSYTTPNIWQYFKILKQFSKLKNKQRIIR